MKTKTPRPAARKLTQVTIRPDTREMIDSVAAAKRWKLVTVIDEALRHYLQTDPHMREVNPTHN